MSFDLKEVIRVICPFPAKGYAQKMHLVKASGDKEYSLSLPPSLSVSLLERNVLGIIRLTLCEPGFELPWGIRPTLVPHSFCLLSV